MVLGVEVGGKNRSKIDEKMKSKREGACWDGFVIDFGGFGRPSWEAKPSQEGAKTRPDRPRKASGRREVKTGKSGQVQGGQALRRRIGARSCRGGRGLHCLKGGALPGALDLGGRVTP